MRERRGDKIAENKERDMNVLLKESLALQSFYEKVIESMKIHHLEHS